MLGKTVIKGTRLTVELIIRKLSEGATNDDIKSMYPDLNNEQIKACIKKFDFVQTLGYTIFN
jgi:uncharacterized protein (DUF433 family)